MFRVWFTPNLETRQRMTGHINNPVKPFTILSQDNFKTRKRAMNFIFDNASTDESRAQYRIEEYNSCACAPYCKNDAQKTPNSPYMNEYCDNCTYERHDISTHSR